MKKVKLLVSICVASTLGLGILSGVYKVQENNKTDNIQVNNEESLDKDTKKYVGKVADKNQEESVKEETINDNSIANNKVNEGIITEYSKDVETGNSESNKENLVESNKEDSVESNKKNSVESNKENSVESQKTEENIVYKDNYVQALEKVEIPNKVEIPEKIETPEKEDTTEEVEKPSQSESDSYIAEIEQAIFTRVNAERTSRGLEPLSYNNTMQKYARIKSKDMGDRGYFAHENPEGELITAQMKRDGVTYNAWGENIAYIQGNQSNSSLAEQFMNNWMNSQGHRENILSSNFESIGIGVYKIGNTYYATQEFYR